MIPAWYPLNHGTYSKLAAAYALSGSLIARQLPQRGSQGRLRRRIPADLPSLPGGQRPVVSPWENNVGALRRQCSIHLFYCIDTIRQIATWSFPILCCNLSYGMVSYSWYCQYPGKRFPLFLGVNTSLPPVLNRGGGAPRSESRIP